MESDRYWTSINKYWAIGCLCALLLGIGVRLVLSNAGTNPILNDVERYRLVSQIARYMFQPLTYVAVAALFAFRVIRMRFVGFWSILFSFIVGGLLSSSSVARW